MPPTPSDGKLTCTSFCLNFGVKIQRGVADAQIFEFLAFYASSHEPAADAAGSGVVRYSA